MTARKTKIETAKKLLSGEVEHEPKVYRVIERNGIKTCSDPDYPDKVRPQDIVFHIEVIHPKHE